VRGCAAARGVRGVTWRDETGASPAGEAGESTQKSQTRAHSEALCRVGREGRPLGGPPPTPTAESVSSRSSRGAAQVRGFGTTCAVVLCDLWRRRWRNDVT
jgi:hypothetical protein